MKTVYVIIILSILWHGSAVAETLSPDTPDTSGEVVPSSASESNIAGDPNSIDYTEQIAQLKQALRDDPLNLQIARALQTLHIDQQRQQREALQGLSAGLRAWLNHRPGLAVRPLETAVQSAQARELSRHYLSIGLEEILTQSRQLAAQPLCPDCGGTGRADCRPCSGTGFRRCLTCRGRGEIVVRDALQWPVSQPCPDCNGQGSTECRQCLGQGTIPCGRCAGEKNHPPLSENPRLQTEIKALLSTIHYLQIGGIDFYTPAGGQRAPGL